MLGFSMPTDATYAPRRPAELDHEPCQSSSAIYRIQRYRESAKSIRDVVRQLLEGKNGPQLVTSSLPSLKSHRVTFIC